MASKVGMKWICVAVALAWAATSGVAITFAGSPSKKPPSVSINDLTNSAADAANNGDYSTALRLYRQLAERGDARAQNKVGVMIADSNPKEAVKWYKLAAAQGYAEAEFRLGLMYEEGNGVPRDKDEAAKWYKLAAEHGYLEAQYKLGDKQRSYAPVTSTEPDCAKVLTQAGLPNMAQYSECRSRMNSIENFLSERRQQQWGHSPNE